MTPWATAAASVIGSVHVRHHLPNQDSVRTWSSGSASVVALADGHGHHLHFRSDVGSALAARCAVEALSAALPTWDDAEAARAAAPQLAADVVAAWRDAVAAHVEENPLAATDPDVVRADPALAYGTTLVAVAASERLVLALQIGDGDIVFVRAGGESFRPLPDDDTLDGVHTSSLCQDDPVADLRHAALDPEGDDVVLAYLCTDGFGKARVESTWWRETGEQLLGLVHEHGVGWVAEQLPSWLEEPALVGGDDTTLAVLCRTAPPTVAIPVVAPESARG